MFTVDIKDQRSDSAATLSVGASGECTIGSDASCDIVLLHDAVQPVHLSIDVLGTGWQIKQTAPEIAFVETSSIAEEVEQSDDTQGVAEEGDAVPNTLADNSEPLQEAFLADGMSFESELQVTIASYELTIRRSDAPAQETIDSADLSDTEEDDGLSVFEQDETTGEPDKAASPVAINSETPAEKGTPVKKSLLVGGAIAASLLVTGGFSISFMTLSAPGNAAILKASDVETHANANALNGLPSQNDVTSAKPAPNALSIETPMTDADFKKELLSAGATHVQVHEKNKQKHMTVYVLEERLVKRLRQVAKSLRPDIKTKIVCDPALRRGVNSIVEGEAENSRVLSLENGHATIELDFEERDAQQAIKNRIEKDLPAVASVKFSIREPKKEKHSYRIQAIWLGSKPYAKIGDSFYYINTSLPGNEVIKSIERDMITVMDDGHVMQIKKGEEK